MKPTLTPKEHGDLDNARLIAVNVADRITGTARGEGAATVRQNQKVIRLMNRLLNTINAIEQETD